MGVGIQTIRKAVSLIEGLVLDHEEDIKRAYLKSDDALTISINVKLAPDKESSHRVKIDAGITFVTERVKDASTASVTEGMASLFDDVASGKVKITVSEPPVEEGRAAEIGDFGKDRPTHKGHTTNVVLSDDGAPVGLKVSEV
jgi:hypothetical protein